MKEIIAYTTENKILQKLTLSKCIDKDILRTTGRLAEIKGKLYVALESFYANGKVLQKNIPAEEAPAVLSQLIPLQYKQMNITTTCGNCEVKVSKKDKITLIDHIKRNNLTPVALAHNRQKQYILSGRL